VSLLLILTFLIGYKFLLYGGSMVPGVKGGIWDPYQYIAEIYTMRGMLDQGVIPLGLTWLPNYFTGVPWTARFWFNSVPIYVVLGLYYALGNPVAAYNVAIFLFMLTASFGAYYYGFVLAKDRNVALVASVIYAFNPYGTDGSWANEAALHIELLFGIAVMPFVLGSLENLFREPTRKNAVTSGLLLTALLLSHFGQLFVYVLVFLLFRFGVQILVRGLRISSFNVKRLLAMIVISFTVVVLSGFALVMPTLVYPSNTPVRTLSEVALYSPPYFSLSYFGYLVSAGVLITIFWFCHKVVTKKVGLDDLIVASYIPITAFFIAWAQGPYAIIPIYQILQQLPVVDLFRVQSRTMVLGYLWVAIMAGNGLVKGVQLAFREMRQKWFSGFNHRICSFNSVIGYMLIILILSEFFVMSASSHPEGNYSGGGVYWLKVYPFDNFNPMINTNTGIMNFLREDNESFRVLTLPAFNTFPAWVIGSFVKPNVAAGSVPGTPLDLGVRSWQRIYVLVMDFVNCGDDLANESALFGVKFIVVDTTPQPPPVFQTPQQMARVSSYLETQRDFRLIMSENGVYLFENMRFMGMAFAVGSRGLVQWIQRGAPTGIRYERLNANVIRLDFYTVQPYILVAESYDKGWVVDDPNFHISDAYGMLLITVPKPGTYSIIIRFSPYQSYLAMVVAGFASTIVFILLVLMPDRILHRHSKLKGSTVTRRPSPVNEKRERSKAFVAPRSSS
jgi:hypothetical protein